MEGRRCGFSYDKVGYDGSIRAEKKGGMYSEVELTIFLLE